MDFIIKLDKPGPDDVLDAEGATFDVTLEKIRGKPPKVTSVNAYLRANADGYLELAHRQGSAEVPKKFRLRRLISENAEKLPQRQLAKKLNCSASTINKFMGKLREENLVHVGTKWGVTDKGEYKLNVWWPTHYPQPEALEGVRSGEIPF